MNISINCLYAFHIHDASRSCAVNMVKSIILRGSLPRSILRNGHLEAPCSITAKSTLLKTGLTMKRCAIPMRPLFENAWQVLS